MNLSQPFSLPTLADVYRKHPDQKSRCSIIHKQRLFYNTMKSFITSDDDTHLLFLLITPAITSPILYTFLNMDSALYSTHSEFYHTLKTQKRRKVLKKSTFTPL